MKQGQPVELTTALPRIPKGSRGRVIEEQKTAVIIEWDLQDGRRKDRFDKYFELQYLREI